jgi:toxin ParE1/3/4
MRSSTTLLSILPRGAKNVQRRIQNVIDLILIYPRVGLPTEDAVIRKMPTPQYPYLIFYEPTDTEIIIHAIRHAARDSDNLRGAE